MITRLTPQFIELVYDAALKSFWRKPVLKRFLQGCRIPSAFLASWDDSETKRIFLNRLFDALQSNVKAETIFTELAKALSEQSAFPDLLGWEDTDRKLTEARQAVARLRQHLEEQDRQLRDKETEAAAKKRFEERQAEISKSQQSLTSLQESLNLFAAELGTQAAGYKFQDWFYDLMDFFEVVSRRPYLSEGRQIDGAVTLKDTTYLVELKFTLSPSGPDDIDSLIRKVTTKADNTLGIFCVDVGIHRDCEK